jgi:hypothetical protein
LKNRVLYIAILVFALACIVSCIPIRHYTITRKTQKWEKEHFDPDRSFSNKRRVIKNSKSKAPAKSNRIG